MGDPAGPGKMYCTSCGELIDRESSYCTYCGSPVKNREFPTERSGPATASDDRSYRQPDTGESEYDDKAYGAQANEYAHESVTDQRGGQQRPPDGTQERDYASPRVGAEPVEAPRQDESTTRAVGVAAGLGILGVVLLAIFSVIGVGILSVMQLPELAILAIATAIGQYIGFMGLGLWYLRTRGYDRQRIISYLGVRMPSLKEIGLVFVGWFAIIVLIIIVSVIAQAFLPEPAENEGAAMLAEGTTNMVMFLGAVLFMFLVVGPCEELLYRGVVQNRLRERLPAVPAILIASLVFAAVHVVALSGGDPLAMATTVGILFVPAIVLGVIYEYTGNLVVPSLLHGLHNSVIIAILFFGPELEEAAEFISWAFALVPF